MRIQDTNWDSSVHSFDNVKQSISDLPTHTKHTTTAFKDPTWSHSRQKELGYFWHPTWIHTRENAWRYNAWYNGILHVIIHSIIHGIRHGIIHCIT